MIFYWTILIALDALFCSSTFASQDAGLAKRRNRRRASSVLPSPLFNTAESGSAMQSELLETCLQDGFMQNRYPAREEVCRNIRRSSYSRNGVAERLVGGSYRARTYDHQMKSLPLC